MLKPIIWNELIQNPRAIVNRDLLTKEKQGHRETHKIRRGRISELTFYNGSATFKLERPAYYDPETDKWYASREDEIVAVMMHTNNIEQDDDGIHITSREYISFQILPEGDHLKREDITDSDRPTATTSEEHQLAQV